MSYINVPNYPYGIQPAQQAMPPLQQVLQRLGPVANDPKATDEKRYEALRLASQDGMHCTPEEVVKRAQVYFEFLSGAKPAGYVAPETDPA